MNQELLFVSACQESKIMVIITGRDIVDKNEITPILREEIEKARQGFRESKTITLASHEDIDKYFESL